MRVAALVLSTSVCLLHSSELFAQQTEFPPGGFTPVFNEVTIAFAITPDRPAPDAKLEDIRGVTERVKMVNRIDDKSGVVQPTIFIRGNTTLEDGLRTQTLQLGHDSGLAFSQIFGGEFTMYVRPPAISPIEAQSLFPNFPKATIATFISVPPDAAIPERVCLGKIQSLQEDAAFPARVEMPVYYSFVSGGKDGKLATTDDNLSVVAKEPHPMQGVVMSIPPSPDDCISSDAWHLVDESTFMKLWIRVECFRFLGIGNYERKSLLEYSPN